MFAYRSRPAPVYRILRRRRYGKPMTMPIAFALAGLVFVAGVLGLFLYFGLRSGRGDLVAPPKSFGKREYGRRPVVRPAPAQLAAPKPGPSRVKPSQSSSANPAPQPAAKPVAAQPEQMISVPIAGASPDSQPAPVWRRETPAGHGRFSEASYSAEQYAEREVKALLLQDRHDRAVRHARTALKLPADEAEAYVERLARGLRV